MCRYTYVCTCDRIISIAASHPYGRDGALLSWPKVPLPRITYVPPHPAGDEQSSFRGNLRLVADGPHWLPATACPCRRRMQPQRPWASTSCCPCPFSFPLSPSCPHASCFPSGLLCGQALVAHLCKLRCRLLRTLAHGSFVIGVQRHGRKQKAPNQLLRQTGLSLSIRQACSQSLTRRLSGWLNNNRDRGLSRLPVSEHDGDNWGGSDHQESRALTIVLCTEHTDKRVLVQPGRAQSRAGWYVNWLADWRALLDWVALRLPCSLAPVGTPAVMLPIVVL